MAVVYIHKRLDTEAIFYVGISTVPSRRVNSHYNRNKYWMNIVNKVGFYSEVIYEDICWEVACEIEKFLIALYGRLDLNTGILVNMTNGGEGVVGNRLSNESIQKMKASKLGKKLTQSHKYKIGKAHKGKLVSKKTKEKMSLSARERNKSKEYIKNLSNSKKKPVLWVNEEGITIKKYPSIMDAAENLGLNYRHISSVCRGKRKTTGNKTFKFYE